MGSEVDPTDFSDDDINSSVYDQKVTRTPKRNLSDILLTPEEKKARHEYRLAASVRFVNEAWRSYRRVTNQDSAIEPANLEPEGPSNHMITRMGVLYDPTAGLRMQFLKKKFAHLLDAFMSLKQAAYKPFLRCQKPKKMDIDGQGLAMPTVVKQYLREVSLEYIHPSTFSYKETWSKTFNSNFFAIEDIQDEQQDAETQVLLADVYQTKFIKPEQPRDTSVEKFDVEDYPLDDEGNPIGKTVGICEWCGQSILPIPYEYTLKNEWHIDSLYCCRKYREFVEDVKRQTMLLEAEYERKNILIDTSSHKDRKKVQHGSQSNADKKSIGGKGKVSKSLEGHLSRMSNVPVGMEDLYLSVGVDTSDLPWDPAQTRYQQQVRYNKERQADKHRNTLHNPDMNILVGLEEVFVPPTKSFINKFYPDHHSDHHMSWGSNAVLNAVSTVQPQQEQSEGQPAEPQEHTEA